MKFDIIKVFLISLIMLIFGVVINIAPILIIILAPFMMIPGAYLYLKSRHSFYAMGVVVTIVTLLSLSLLTLQIIIAALVASFIIGRLIVERASRELMYYVITAFLSLYTLLSVIFLQIAKLLPTTDVWAKNINAYYEIIMAPELKKGTITQDTLTMFQDSIYQLQLLIPGVVVFSIFLLVLLAVNLTLVILRKLKLPTPKRIPLYLWNIPKIVLYLYFISAIVGWLVPRDSVVTYGIVTNLRYVLEWIIFIQGLSLASYFVKMKKSPIFFKVIMFVLAFMMMPVTQIFGMLDMMLNIKSRIKS